MATNSIAIPKDVEATSFWQGAVVVLGRFFFALIFLFAAPITSPSKPSPFGFSRRAFASIAVPLSGVVAIAGGLSILLGYRAKTWRLAHRAVPDSGHVDVAQVLDRKRSHDAQIQMILFMKNVSMLGRRPADFSVRCRTFSLDARRSL